MQETTSNGVRYNWTLAGPNGAGFIVFKDNHTAEEVKQAISEIRKNRDVVWLRRADESDYIDDFWSKMFYYAEKKYKLKWHQIERNDKEIAKAIRQGISYEDYADSKYSKNK
jgi:hypothetical protein